MSDPHLPALVNKFLRDVWLLDKDGRFPPSSNIHSQIVMDSDGRTASLEVVSHIQIGGSIEIGTDRFTWRDLEVSAADPQFFDKLAGVVAHIILFNSMGGDNIKSYTAQRIAHAKKRRMTKRIKRIVIATLVAITLVVVLL